MKKKIFLKFFALSFISALLVFFGGLVAVTLSAKSLVRERLEAETNLACALVNEKEDYAYFKEFYNNDEFRVTVFDLGGNVIYESDKVAEKFENHSDREEFKQALNGKSQAIERYSDTFKCKMTYFAQKTSLSNGEEIIIRLAVKNTQVSDYMQVALPVLFAVLIISVFLSVYLAKTQSKSISSSFNEVGDSLKSLNDGTYLPIKADENDEELFTVLNEINELSVNLLTHIVTKERERQKLNVVLKNVSQGIIAVSSTEKIVFANKSALKFFEIDQATDLKGKTLCDLIGDTALCNKISESSAVGDKFEYIYNGVTFKVAVKPITDETLSEDVTAIIILTDVTQEKAVQKQKSDFFANASHELKTPVTVMQGLAEILLNKDLDESAKKQVERIYKESVRLSSLISDMLKLSKLERGDETAEELCKIDLGLLVKEALTELSGEIAKKNLTVSFNGEGEILADPKRIYELIGNLLSNAVNYNVENGLISVEILKGENYITLTVKDSGIGIEKEHIPRLCERFYRVDKSRSKKTGGTGLGLAIVKHVCAIYKAELSIESELNKGTTVTVCFPIIGSDA